MVMEIHEYKRYMKKEDDVLSLLQLIGCMTRRKMITKKKSIKMYGNNAIEND